VSSSENKNNLDTYSEWVEEIRTTKRNKRETQNIRAKNKELTKSAMVIEYELMNARRGNDCPD
jgi:hypothetical protein